MIHNIISALGARTNQYVKNKLSIDDDIVIVRNLVDIKGNLSQGIENKIVLFPNTPISWHRITIRKCSEHPRRFICMRLETKLKLHNYQTKNGKDVMIYEDLKNNYE